MVMLALFGLAMNHCQLEHVPGFAWLACCCAEDSPPVSPADCAEQVCHSVETGAFLSRAKVEILTQPVLLPVFDRLAVEPLGSQYSHCPVPAEPVPPGLAKRWPFSLRQAPSPRAPSALV